MEQSPKAEQALGREATPSIDERRFLSLSAIGWIIASAISSSLIDKNQPDAISVALSQIFSSGDWVNGIASLAGSITAGGIPGILICGILLLFFKKLRTLRNFLLVSAAFNLAFGIWLS